MGKQRDKKKSIKKSGHLLSKIFIPMIVLAVMQIIILIIALIASGEFSYLRRNSYSFISEKAENRKNNVEVRLNQIAVITNDSAGEINNIVKESLGKKNKKAADIGNDKELDKFIIRETAGSLIKLIRNANINDAYIILESDGLYDSDGKKQRTGLYLRDTDVNNNSVLDNKDIFVEMGSSEISHSMKLSLDSEWALYADMTDEQQFAFYYNAIENAKDNPNLSMDLLGYWSRFSKISDNAKESFKYTIPLISDDGEVYGVLGIGLFDKTLQQNMPSKDFMNDSACYLFAVDLNDDEIYKIVMHSGPAYVRLFGEDTDIKIGKKDKYGLYSFLDSTKADSVGSFYEVSLYKKGSPYKYQKWILVCIADKTAVLKPYTTIIKTLVLSLLISFFISVLLSFVISGLINSPVKKMIKRLNSNRQVKNIISFEPSGIEEIDKLGEAVSNLQKHVVEDAYRLSKIISMAGNGIGVFMYDLALKEFFVGESLVKLLDFDIQQEGDITLRAKIFWKMLEEVDKDNLIKDSRIFVDENVNSERIELQYTDSKKDETRWIRVNMYKDTNSIVCLMQDITDSVIEMKKIEYERDYDITTGLLNRRAFYYKLSRVFSDKNLLKTAACFMFDLDNLKYVNDTYGHDFGDDYIKTAAGVFRQFEYENSIVSRLSGDEFVLFFYGYDGKDEIRRIKNELYDKLRESFCVLPDGAHYKMRASGGVSWYPYDAEDSDLLIKYADFAMYTVKHSTKGNIGEFDEVAYRNDSVLVNGIEELNRIIDEGSIRYAFQSIVSARTGEIYGYEALMRPISEKLNTPLEFIRIAKADAKLNEVEKLTWCYGLKYYKEQVEKGNIDKDAKIFLNTIPNNMIDDDCIKEIEHEYADYLHNIVVEILESEQTNDDYINKKKEVLASWNGILALDDFGTGYNSEYALLELKPDLIKIDRSLISGCDKDISRTNMIRDIVNIAKRGNIVVLAEGIETYDEMKTVINCGVDLLQGFYLSKPLYEPDSLSVERKSEILELRKNNQQ